MKYMCEGVKKIKNKNIMFQAVKLEYRLKERESFNPEM